MNKSKESKIFNKLNSSKFNFPVIILCVLVFFIGTNEAFTYTKNNVYFEFGGDAFLGSINYEKLLNSKLYLRTGLMVWNNQDRNSSGTETSNIFLLGAGYIYRLKNNSNLEIGLTVSERNSNTVFTVPVGYRYQPKNSGFMFRITVVPFFSQEGLMPWGGISLGYTF
ncbi:hypothetical protein KAJ27_05010 [bacterium]|nr:hypothetical protein [bacterium]